MDGVNKTLYIPLYGKALVSRKGILLEDQWAERIWEKEGFALKGKTASKWLAYTMGMRAKVFDRWAEEKMQADPDAVVLHIGCGLDSRSERVKRNGQLWYDIDFPDVIAVRRKYYREEDNVRLIAADMRQASWKEAVSGQRAIVIMEGASMYFRPEELSALLQGLGERFHKVSLLMDCYTVFAAKASKYKNPINDVGVTQVYGLEDPAALARETGFSCVAEHDLTPTEMIDQLEKGERRIFRFLYAGSAARKLYRLYEFQKG